MSDYSCGSGASGNAVGGLLPSPPISRDSLPGLGLDDLLADGVGVFKLHMLLCGLTNAVDDVLDASQSVTMQVMPLSRFVTTLSGRVGDTSANSLDDHETR